MAVQLIYPREIPNPLSRNVISATGNGGAQALITAPPQNSQVIWVPWLWISLAGIGTVQFFSGGTALTGAIPVAAGIPLILSPNQPLVKGNRVVSVLESILNNPADPINVQVTNAVAYGGWIDFAYVTPSSVS